MVLWHAVSIADLALSWERGAIASQMGRSSAAVVTLNSPKRIHIFLPIFPCRVCTSCMGKDLQLPAVVLEGTALGRVARHGVGGGVNLSFSSCQSFSIELESSTLSRAYIAAACVVL